MRPAVTAAALVAMSVLAACGGHEPSGGSPSLSSRELQWVQAWGVWAKAVSRASFEAHRAFNDLEAADHDARLRATLPALRSCGRFERRLGEPTAGRFRPAYRVSADVCARLRAAAAGASRTLHGDEAELINLQDEFSRAEGSLEEAYGLLKSTLAVRRPLPRVGGRDSGSRVEPLFSRVATRIASKPVRVRCWSIPDWQLAEGEWHALYADRGDLAGFADPPANIDLAPDICTRLVAIGYGTRAAEGADDAYAVAVLAHETEHLVAPDSESVTECYGMQEIRRAARDLGQSPLAAAVLAEVYWREDYPEKPDRYRTPDCRDGGPLDANPNSSVWP